MPVLEFLLSSSYDLAAVVTTPDRPRGRGLLLQSNPVKQRCEARGTRVFAPESLRGPEASQEIRALKPNAFVVASYGKMIPSSWLEIPSQASFNVHPSLLPKHRGAAPIPWQIVNGDKEIGVSIAEVTKELDAGDIFGQIRIPAEETDTTESLTRKLAELGCRVLEEVLGKLELGKLERTPQDSSQSSYARKLTKEDSHLNLNEWAELSVRKIRAFQPWPGTFLDYQSKPLRILEAHLGSNSDEKATPGVLLDISPRGDLRIQTEKDILEISKVQLPGKRVISAKEFVNGERLKPGFIFKSLSS